MTFFKKIHLLFASVGSEKTLRRSKRLSDNELIEQIVSTNNSLLFSTLYDRYSKKVYNKCYSFAKDEDEAKDLTQDVFIKLYIKLNTYQGKSKFSTWLYSFTYNFCVNYKKRDQGSKISDISDSMEKHDYHLEAMDDIDDEELFEMRVRKLEVALNRIAPEDKAILLLKYQDDVSVKNIQKVLNIGESAVKMRLKRAKRKVIDEHNKIK
jgi:RNA polymerase sigma factor (sigma-70 family)